MLADVASGQFDANAPQRAAQLRSVLSSLGPSFVKVGQALSARPDLLPKPYLDALSELQDRLPSFPSTIAYTGERGGVVPSVTRVTHWGAHLPCSTLQIAAESKVEWN